MLNDSRSRNKRIKVSWFKTIYKEFLTDNKGYSNPLDYLIGVYGNSTNADKTPDQRATKAMVKWFKSVYSNFLADNKGFLSPIEYVENVYLDLIKYDEDKKYWAKIARKAGYKCILRYSVYYFEA